MATRYPQAPRNQLLPQGLPRPTNLDGVRARLFEYDNFRIFLKDYFDEQKRFRKIFTHRFFAKKGGFSNPSYCHYIMLGRYNVTPPNLRRLIKALDFDTRYGEYFEKLVAYNQAESFEERQELAKILEMLRKKASFYKLNRDQCDFFSAWYYPVLRVIAGYGEWHGDFKRLGQLVQPPINAEKAREAIETLVRIGLLIQEKSVIDPEVKPPTYRVSTEAISTENVPPVLMKTYRREMLMRVVEVADSLPPEDRYIAYSTLGMGRETYGRICEYLKEVRRHVLQMALSDPSVERVYQLNLNIIPLSRPFSPKPRQMGPGDVISEGETAA